MITHTEEESHNNNEFEPKIQQSGSNNLDEPGIPANPFESQQHQRFDEDFEMPNMTAEQQQQQQQQLHQQQQQHHQVPNPYYAGYGYQQHPQQQQHWQQQQHYVQHHQHQMYPPQHSPLEHQHHQQHQLQHQHHQYNHSHAGYGYHQNMYGPMYNGATSPQTTPTTNATPSPTTNSDDSSGDCVTESKQRMLAQSHQSSVQQIPVEQRPATFYPNARGVPLVQKRPRQTRRNKKKRDPNEPQKPVSAYALFFRDMQAGIKARNPNASFGEVSKHVAAMWDNLNPDHKAAYKKRTENAKKEYLKQLAAYRANLVSKNHNDPYNPYCGISSYYKSPGSNAFDYPTRDSNGANRTLDSPGMSMGSPAGHQMDNRYGNQQGSQPHTPCTSTASSGTPTSNFPSPRQPSNQLQATPTEDGSNMCRRPGCTNTILDYSMNGFCSNDCVLNQSREVYNSWSSNSGGPNVGDQHPQQTHSVGPVAQQNKMAAATAVTR